MIQKMTGKYHFEETAAQGRKILCLCMRAACFFGGAKLDTLALKYKIYIRPRTKTFPDAAAAQKSQIDKAQNATLRLIAGSVKTTQIDAMEWYDQIEPLLLRIEKRRATRSCMKNLHASTPITGSTPPPPQQRRTKILPSR